MRGRLELEPIMPEDPRSTQSLELAVEVAVAWLSNPNTEALPGDVALLLERLQAALTKRGFKADRLSETIPVFTPAVTIRRSLASKDYLISLIDGKPYKSLKRHLSRHGLTPAQYRERYGLTPDYPMVSESYSQLRRQLAAGRRVPAGSDEAFEPAAASEDDGDTSAGPVGTTIQSLPAPPTNATSASRPSVNEIARAEVTTLPSAPDPTREVQLTIMEGIARARLITAQYNGKVIRLAPHMLFERRGDLFVSALNVGKVWRNDEEPRLGQFKLAGLQTGKLVDEPFEPLAGFSGTAPRSDDIVLFSILQNT